MQYLDVLLCLNNLYTLHCCVMPTKEKTIKSMKIQFYNFIWYCCMGSSFYTVNKNSSKRNAHMIIFK